MKSLLAVLEPIPITGGEVVDSRIRSEGTGHSYFLSNPATISDLILVHQIVSA